MVGPVAMRTRRLDGRTQPWSFKPLWIHDTRLQRNSLFLCSFVVSFKELGGFLPGHLALGAWMAGCESGPLREG